MFLAAIADVVTFRNRILEPLESLREDNLHIAVTIGKFVSELA